MAIKNYMINDKWLDIAKQNIVEVESTDGVIGSVKVNGQEYGGGGGSSDFSTAQVTIVNNTGKEHVNNLLMPIIDDGTIMAMGPVLVTTNTLPSGIFTVPLYKGALNTAYIGVNPSDVTVSGNATYDDGDITITGDCTITVSAL